MSLRDQLARKRAHSAAVTFPLGQDGERAKAELADAERQLAVARYGGNADVVKRAEARQRKANNAYERASVTITVRGLTEEERDALTSAHPAPETEQDEQDKDKPPEEREAVNRATFLPAALSLAALDSDLTEAEWASELASDRWAAGERLALFRTVVSATNEEPAPGLPKG